MPISYILPTLVDAFLDRILPDAPTNQTTSSPYYLQESPVYYPARYPTLFHPKVVEAATVSCSWTPSCMLHLAAKLASNLVPLVNLFLALLVFAYLVDERVHPFLISQFTLLPTPPTAAPSSTSDASLTLPTHTTDLKGRPSPSPTAPLLAPPANPPPPPTLTSPNPLSPLTTLILSSSLFALMLSMIFLSNSIFDTFASTLPHDTPSLRSLLPLAAYFASFTLLVCFLLATLLLHLLLPFNPPTRSVVGMICAVLMTSSVLSRFPLAVYTVWRGGEGMDGDGGVMGWVPHVMMLAVEPAGLMAIAGYVGLGMGCEEREEGEEEEKVGQEEEKRLLQEDEMEEKVEVIVVGRA